MQESKHLPDETFFNTSALPWNASIIRQREPDGLFPFVFADPDRASVLLVNVPAESGRRLYLFMEREILETFEQGGFGRHAELCVKKPQQQVSSLS